MPNKLSSQITKDERLESALLRAAERNFSRVSLVVGTETLTYKDLWDLVRSATSALKSAPELQSVQTVAISLPNPIALVTWLIGIMKSGRVPVLLPEERGHWPMHLKALRGLSVDHLITTSQRADAVPGARQLAHFDHDTVLLRLSPDRACAEPDWLSSDPALVVFTSGTTGIPKAVLHSHRALLFTASRLQDLQREFFTRGSRIGLTQGVRLLFRHRGALLRAARRQTWMTDLSPTSVSGLILIVQALYSGHTLVLSVRHQPRELLEQIQCHHVSMFATVPAVLRALVNSGLADSYKLSALMVIGVGGGLVTSELVEEARDRFHCEVLVGYGSTELGGGVLVTRLSDSPSARSSTVGRPFPGVLVSIRDDQDKECAVGDVGELWCMTPGMMVGYIDGHLIDNDHLNEEPRWVKTHDLAELKRDGTVRIVGRSDDLIVRGGRKIAPAEIESHLLNAPGVFEAVAAGVRDQNGEDVIHVWIVPDPGATIAPTALRAAVASDAPPWLVPQHVHIVTELPKTSDGRVRRGELVAVMGRRPL